MQEIEVCQQLIFSNKILQYGPRELLLSANRKNSDLTLSDCLLCCILGGDSKHVYHWEYETAESINKNLKIDVSLNSESSTSASAVVDYRGEISTSILK